MLRFAPGHQGKPDPPIQTEALVDVCWGSDVFAQSFGESFLVGVW